MASCVLGMERREAGWLLLDLLGVDDWAVTVEACDVGVRVTAEGWGSVVQAEGLSVADVSILVFEGARRARRAA